MRVVLALCRIATGALFLHAASTKLPDMATFAGEVANYRLLPANAGAPGASGPCGACGQQGGTN